MSLKLSSNYPAVSRASTAAEPIDRRGRPSRPAAGARHCRGEGSEVAATTSSARGAGKGGRPGRGSSCGQAGLVRGLPAPAAHRPGPDIDKASPAACDVPPAHAVRTRARSAAFPPHDPARRRNCARSTPDGVIGTAEETRTRHPDRVRLTCVVCGARLLRALDHPGTPRVDPTPPPTAARHATDGTVRPPGAFGGKPAGARRVRARSGADGWASPGSPGDGAPAGLHRRRSRGRRCGEVSGGPAAPGTASPTGRSRRTRILGMRERAQSVGGRLGAQPRQDGGFTVLAELPAD